MAVLSDAITDNGPYVKLNRLEWSGALGSGLGYSVTVVLMLFIANVPTGNVRGPVRAANGDWHVKSLIEFSVLETYKIFLRRPISSILRESIAWLARTYGLVTPPSSGQINIRVPLICLRADSWMYRDLSGLCPK
jgi:hypothetical protein